MSAVSKGITRRPAPEVLLFDLDGTLYPVSNGYNAHMRQNLWRFMSEKLGVEEPEKVWRPLFQKYNQTAKALRVGGGYEFDLDEFWAFLRYGQDQFLKEAPEGLKNVLENLPQAKKYVFTNCNEKEAEEALEILGIRHHFKGVFGAGGMGDMCKPDREAFHKLLESIGADPTNSAMFEDSFKNLVTAKAVGMSTIFVRSETANEEGVDQSHLESVDAVVDEVTESELRANAPWLWPEHDP